MAGVGGGVGYAYGITNIEYTEFKRLGIQDEAQCEGSQLSVFPANTNVLYLGLKVCDPPTTPADVALSYVDVTVVPNVALMSGNDCILDSSMRRWHVQCCMKIQHFDAHQRRMMNTTKAVATGSESRVLSCVVQAAEAAVRAGAEGDGGAALPGLIFNGSKCVEEPDLNGGPATLVPAGRLECTMQVSMRSFHTRAFVTECGAACVRSPSRLGGLVVALRQMHGARVVCLVCIGNHVC